MEISIGITGGLFIILLIISLVLYRNWKYEQELDSLLWKVDFRDIQINDETNTQNLGTKITRVSMIDLYFIERGVFHSNSLNC